MFCDARSSPPRIAAVVCWSAGGWIVSPVGLCWPDGGACSDGQIDYCDMEPAASTMQLFQSRRDNQITSLEILSIALGVSTFEATLSGREVLIFSDNKGAEGACRKGARAHCTSQLAGIVRGLLQRCREGI